ncbi:hypothetical protein [Yinghuangia soli]|uniref:Uncharacterized protein n=1 Tax=Yinghuangia soli TaxID=2908204 RepID=A0AA41U8V7_9ACTN|nr:hypothetical protein [Yinghuangia soli]MCF2533279.1 hypothetical protein [Yinghuangia soli]
MSITAQLRDSVRLPGGEALVGGLALESRGDGEHHALLRNEHALVVHDLARLFKGDRVPTAVVPLPWPAWDRSIPSVSPDGSYAVFSGQRAVRAVSATGEVLWEYRHACWGPVTDHTHTGDEQELCYGLEHGSCRVSDDGRLVWAHVMVELPEPDEYEFLECWVVLDARDGRELARLPLEDSVASGSHQLSHPDGVHVGLCIGMGQDGILLYWARWDGEKLIGWDLNQHMDRILTDVHPGHAGFLTVDHECANLQLHALDGTVLSEGPPEPTDDGELPYWDYLCGFVDADTVIGSTLDSDDPGHWLLDAHTLAVRGRLAYPTGPVESYVRPLGDGTWLTYDTVSETLNRWSAAAS